MPHPCRILKTGGKKMAEAVKKTAKETVKDNKYYNEHVTVKAVNGKGMIVPRGKEVKIPRKYAIALKNSEAQDSFAAEFQAELAKGANAAELN